ncbi:type I pullulanase [Aquibacillus kalidii]|uniref:type I pullulanase n=1 Tax=Aquibacillus kalidii TaxID=2762597 RepID=UPI001F299646|nr:type I pullulanase [Aquibacillus kalidii]
MTIAWLDEKDRLTVDLSEVSGWNDCEPKVLIEEASLAIDSVDVNDDRMAQITLTKPMELGKDATLIWEDHVFPIYPRKVVRTAWFDDVYDASEEQLGFHYTKSQTSFHVWAPTAVEVKLLLNNTTHPMSRKSCGAWHLTVAGDWHGALYAYIVTVNGKEQLVNDPYAIAMTANSGSSVVLDLTSTDPDQFRELFYPSIPAEEAVIYELHVRDATVAESSGVKHKGKFLGLTEKNTCTQAGLSTGLSYIASLGCTHVQLLPIQDYARVDEENPKDGYNWGYDPLYYFVPEGSYATDATIPSVRVKECKQMIHAIHQQGLAVIIDVVFNHVFDQAESALEKLVPGYYFRYHSDGQLSNGSGTGNDLATERKMVRKLILDCVNYWIEEYQVDGFRFDLMGLIDVKTMQMVREHCLEVDRPILLLGEGWELDTQLAAEQMASLAQADQLLGISFFNDQFRDVVKGSQFDAVDTGFVNGHGKHHNRMDQLVSGCCQSRFNFAMFLDPKQSVNYVECHDNHTLWDRLLLSNPELDDHARIRMHQLATGLVILSQGIPFLHAGQEFYRTKQGDENSYLSGDAINQLDWERRAFHDDNVDWVRSLIALRKKYYLFRMKTVREIDDHLHMIVAPDPVLGFMLMGVEEDIVVFVNPTDQDRLVEMPATGRWQKCLSNLSKASRIVSCQIDLSTKLGAYELAVWVKRRG